jgi:Carboxypeptidase regulatory-like domain
MRKMAVLVVTVGIALASCSSKAAPASPAPGVLSGVVLGHLSQGKQTPLAGATVGVYRRATSSGGPVQQDPPQPVATATTDKEGAFRFLDLPAGRWFVLAQDQAGQGAWVDFDPAIGGTLTLVVCTDCPIPL